MSQHQATKQFDSVIKADLNRWLQVGVYESHKDKMKSGGAISRFCI